MKYALYLGCVIPVRGRNYELSTRKVAQRLGIEFVDIEAFSCCGLPIRYIDWQTSLLMAARNLSLAESLGLDICAPCSGCASMLTGVNRLLREDSDLSRQVNDKLARVGHHYEGGVNVKHFARILYEDIGTEQIKAAVTRSLAGLKVATHYGCHYLKPSLIYDGFDDPEHPRSLDEMVAATGATPLAYEYKNQCCGLYTFGVDAEIAYDIAHTKLEHVKAAGADAIILACPACAITYDHSQRSIAKKFDAEYDLPVLFITQLIGLALGFEPAELGFNLNRVKTDELLARLMLEPV
jgi:heterodisulfide reductase subunit B